MIKQGFVFLFVSSYTTNAYFVMENSKTHLEHVEQFTTSL